MPSRRWLGIASWLSPASAIRQNSFQRCGEAGISVPVTQAFPDHHRYSRHEAEALVDRAAREDLVLVTTEKDLVRIARDPELATLAKVARALPVTLQIDDEEPLRELLFQKAP